MVQLFTILVGESIAEGHPSHEYFIKRYQSARSTLTEEIKNAQANGKMRNDIKPEELAIMIFAMMDGLQIQWLLESEEVSMSNIFTHFIDLLRGNS